VVTEVAALRDVVSPAPRGIWQAVFDRDAETVPYQSPQSPVKAEHVRAVVDDLTPRARYLQLNIRPNPRAADVWRAAMPAGAHRVDRMARAIDLDGGFDAVWHGRL
jgi:hypothetical protein